MPPKAFELTPEVLALQAERRARKLQSAGEPPAADPKDGILRRDWIHVQDVPFEASPARRLRFMTWNMLAQTLVRRELFPASDCLKASHREPMTVAELLAYDADVLCLQEADRLDRLLPPLERAGYAHLHAAGPRKLHGCMIVHRSARLQRTAERTVLYDELSAARARPEVGRVTKNVGLLAAFRSTDADGPSFIVATTHLFWHPSYIYERARQAALLLREVIRFREEEGGPMWPCFLIGDFNFTPLDPAYALLTRQPLTTQQEAKISRSRVIHVSVDPSITTTGPMKADDDEGGGGGEQEQDPDRTFVNCRPCASEDELLTLGELQALFAQHTPLRSMYDHGLRTLRSRAQEGAPADLPELYSSKGVLPSGEVPGSCEPLYTSYTHYWKATLDYLFVLEPPEPAAPRPAILQLLRPHRSHHMEPGLPKRGLCASDHMSLVADMLL